MSAGTDYLAKPILDWLRERADGSLAGRKYREAADEIERLRGVLAKAQNDLEDERRQRHFTAGETEKVIRALHAAAVQPTVTTTAGSEKPTYVLANPPPKCPLCGGDYFSHPRLGITHSCATTPMQATGRTPSPTTAGRTKLDPCFCDDQQWTDDDPDWCTNCDGYRGVTPSQQSAIRGPGET